MRSALPLLAAGLVACAAPARELPLVRLEARNFRFPALDTATAGFVRVRLVNADPVWHEASVVRLTDLAATIAAYVAAVQGGDEYPSFAQDVGGVALLGPGDSAEVVLDLAPGRYAVLCWHQDHLLQGMSAMLHVRSGDAPGMRPVAADSLALTDFSITAVAPVAGRHLLHIRNAGPQEHELAILRLEPGRSLDDWMAWRKAGETGRAPGRTIGGTAALAVGAETWASVPWERGVYELICLLSDSAGTEHVHRGMRRTITVP